MAKTSFSLMTVSVTATAAITQCRAVSLGGAPTAVDIFGIANSDGIIGDMVALDVWGGVAVESGAAIPLGTKYVIADAAGRAIPGGTVNACLGKLYPRQSATAAGEYVQVLLELTV